MRARESVDRTQLTNCVKMRVPNWAKPGQTAHRRREAAAVVAKHNAHAVDTVKLLHYNPVRPRSTTHRRHEAAGVVTRHNAHSVRARLQVLGLAVGAVIEQRHRGTAD